MEHFFRSYPDYGEHQAGYCITAGLEQFTGWALTTRTAPGDVDALRGHRSRTGDALFGDDFLEWFATLDFGALRIDAVPEGRVVHANTPITVVEGLLGNGARVRAHDPVAREVAARLFDGRGVEFVDEPYAAAEGADALLLVTEWNEFRQPDLGRLKRVMRQPVLLDGRNIWDEAKARAAGFTYYGVGRNAGT